MKIAVIGTGRVGLVTCVALATLGNEVRGTDIDGETIDDLRRGIPPFYEPGLAELLSREMAADRLTFTPTAAEALADAQVVFICVGTPARADGEANLLAVEQAVSQIARFAMDGAVVAEKSTVPPGTADRVRQTLMREGARRNVFVASNPEFLREGMAIHDALHPERVVIGVGSERSREILEELYSPLIRQGARLIVTDVRTAELAKHATNAFLALKISFVNALARLCELGGGDVVDIAEVMGSDRRIGRAFLDAGLGFGGYCLPKDIAALERLAARVGYPFPLLGEIGRLNQEAVAAIVAHVEDAVWNLEGKRIALLGLAFKADTDDVRSSPALTLAARLLAEGAEVIGYDPQASRPAKPDLAELQFADSVEEAAVGAHCLVIATDWPEFRQLDLASLRNLMARPVVVDGRNLLDPAEMRSAGFWYYPTGRPPVVSEDVSHARDGGVSNSHAAIWPPTAEGAARGLVASQSSTQHDDGTGAFQRPSRRT